MSWINRWLTIFLVILIPSLAWAELGDLFSQFQPYITLQEEYTDNLDLTPRNTTSDFITTVYPGLKISTLPRSTRTGEFRPASSSQETSYGVDFDYRAGFNFYAKETDRNYVGVNGTLNAWYTLDRRLTFRARNYSLRSQEPREQDYSSTALPGQSLLATQITKDPYFRNVFQPSVEYQFGKENRLALNYVNNIYRTQNPSAGDSTENSVNPTLTYWFDIRNGVSLEYGLSLGHFQKSPDLTGQRAAARYIHRFNPRTSLYANYAFLRQDFDPPGNDYDVHTPTFGIDHAFSRTLSGRAQLGYFWQDSQNGSTQRGLNYALGLTQRAQRTTYTLSFQGGYTEDYFTSQNLGFTLYHRGIGTVTYRLMQKMTVGLTGSLERAEYATDRKDVIYGISGNASYQLLRWLSVSLNASHRRDDSDNNAFGYTENRAMLGITAAY